jgi:integration host factor subunit beta
MSTITKKELVDQIAITAQTTQARTNTIIDSFLDEIIIELAKGNRLEFRDFGIFKTMTRTARVAQNPKTLEQVHVPAKRVVKSKMGRLMRQKLNGQYGRA